MLRLLILYASFIGSRLRIKSLHQWVHDYSLSTLCVFCTLKNIAMQCFQASVNVDLEYVCISFSCSVGYETNISNIQRPDSSVHLPTSPFAANFNLKTEGTYMTSCSYCVAQQFAGA